MNLNFPTWEFHICNMFQTKNKSKSARKGVCVAKEHKQVIAGHDTYYNSVLSSF